VVVVDFDPVLLDFDQVEVFLVLEQFVHRFPVHFERGVLLQNVVDVVYQIDCTSEDFFGYEVPNVDQTVQPCLGVHFPTIWPKLRALEAIPVAQQLGPT
jgi:hypothetical protein